MKTLLHYYLPIFFVIFLFASEKIKAQDVGVIGIASPIETQCGDSNTVIALVIKNFGSSSQSSTPVEVNVGSTTITQTLSISLGANKQDTFNLSKTINTYSGGKFSFKAYTKLSGDKDNSNDTTTKTIEISGVPANPNISDLNLCGPQNTEIIAQSPKGDTTFWYDKKIATDPTYVGDTFKVAAFKSKTYYVSYGQAAGFPLKITECQTGTDTIEIQNLAGSGFDATGLAVAISDDYSNINIVNSNIWYLSKLKGGEVQYKTDNSSGSDYWGSNMFWNESGDPGWAIIYDTATGEVVDFVAWQWKSKDISNFAPTINGKKIKLGKGWTGDGVTSCTAGSIYRNVADNDDKSDFSCRTGTCNKANKMKVEGIGTGCESQRVPVTINVNPLPDAKIVVDSVEVTGTEKSPEQACLGDTIFYELVPPTGYTYLSFGTSWTITSRSFETKHGNPPADTMSIPPTLKTNAMVRYIPSSSEFDSVYRLAVTVKFLKTGCEKVLEDYVRVRHSPTADFSVTDICNFDTAQFQNKSKIGFGVIRDYLWVFGDGDSSTIKNPEHIYSKSGKISVKLMVTSGFECTAEVTKPINVFAEPDPDFTIPAPCSNDSIRFKDNSQSGSGTITNYLYVFEGSASTNPNPAFYSGSLGMVSASLTLENSNGCIDSVTKQFTILEGPSADFSIDGACKDAKVSFTDNSINPGTGSLTYNWSFGDGMGNTNANSEHVYKSKGNYPVVLKVTSTNGCIDSLIKNLTIYEPPVPSYTVGTSCQDDTTLFTNTTTPNGAKTVTYEWLLDGGKKSTLENATYILKDTMSHQVMLIAKSEHGCADTFSNSVKAERPNTTFTFKVTNGIAQFSPAVTSYSSYYWDFGDGKNSNSVNPAHKYTESKLFKVTLKVTNQNGCEGSETQNVPVFIESGIDEASSLNNTIKIFPNPFSHVTIIDYELPERAMVKIEVVNTTGKVIEVLADEMQSNGTHQVVFDPEKRGSAPGPYMVRFIVNDQVASKTVVYMK